MKKILLLTNLCAALLFANYCNAQSSSDDINGKDSTQKSPIASHFNKLSGDINGKDSTLPDVGFGLIAGANMQNIASDLWEKTYNPGISGGIFMRMYKNKFAARAEVLITTTRFTSIPISDTNGTVQPIRDSIGNRGDFRATYINIPILFEYHMVSWLSLHLGVQYSNMLSLKSLNDFSPNVKVLFKQGVFSGIIGVEANLPMNILGGARYIHGLTNINNGAWPSAPGSWNTHAIQIYVGYKIK